MSNSYMSDFENCTIHIPQSILKECNSGKSIVIESQQSQLLLTNMHQEEEAKICFRSLSISHFTPFSREKTEQLWVLSSGEALNWVAQERMRFQDLKEVEGPT